ncbi:hypothetical protein [Nocardiopsis sp. B62]|uniref:hypothetical protein n=1 Tax=Nocardiopsis sp. B62 TaxID=2824874 RepID=UPI001B36AE9C|nr:hypothetical protein [Nocardiopsis sp. B62]MBQ1080651.1 hypothetical protein [Nocardiopsis sp. B62]
MHTPRPRLPRIRVSASVMSHPRRAESARRVAEHTGLPLTGLALDPDPDGPPTALRSATVAFGAAERYDTTHHLVLQDDVRLAEGFAGTVERYLDAHPGAAVSFFVEWGSRTATLARWAVFTGAGAVPVVNPYVPTVALALPSGLSADLAGFLAAEGREEEPDDREVLRFVRRTGTRALVAVPTPVEHEELPSLVGNSGHGARRSVCFAAVPVTDPETSVLEPPRPLPHLNWTTGEAALVDLDHDVPESHVPLAGALAAWGADGARMSAALAASTGVGPVAELVPPPYLGAVWHTAVANGAVLEGRWPGVVGGLRDRRGETAVEGALATLVPGALRTVVDVDVLEERRSAVVSLTLDALEFGAEYCPAPREAL